MEEEFMALNFVKNNPFFKKDAEKRMSASFCGSMSLVSEVVISDPIMRRPHGRSEYRGMGIISSSSRSKSAFSLSESKPDTMVVEGTTVKLRRTDSTRRKEMAARRETVEILMEEIVRENRKPAAELEAEENASSGSDLEYGPGIVEKLKAKFGRISSDKKRKNHKRHHSVDDILEESAEYGSYDRRHGRQLTVPDRSSQTLDRSPRHSSGSEQMSRRTSRSCADLGTDDYGDRRAFSLQRPSRREEYERQQEERLEHRLSIEEEDMVDIRELRKMFDRPVEGVPAPAPWRNDARRERFIERGRTHQTVPPNLGDSRRDAPPPRELRLSAPSAPITMDHEADGEYTLSRAVPLKKTIRRISEREESQVFDEESETEPEFVKMARRLRRATIDLQLAEDSAPSTQQPLAILTAQPPADPAPPTDDHLVSPPTGRRDSFTGAASDVSPPPEEPKPPMRLLSTSEVDLSSNHSDAGSRYSSLARSEKSDRSRSESTHVPYSDLSLPRSDFSSASKASKRSVSTEGGVRMGYSRSTSSERRASTYTRIVPENQEASGVEEMQRLLSKFNSRKPREEEAKEAPHADALLLAAREAPAREETAEGRSSCDPCSKGLQPQPAPRSTTVVLSPEPERRTRFVPTVVGIRSSDGRQLLSPTTPSPPAAIAAELLQAAANVVSISVRESTPSVIYTNNRTGSYDLQHAQQQQCDEDDSDVRRSSVGSTASSTVSTSSIAESLTSSGCSSSEDLAVATGEESRPRSLLPPTTPPRRESLENSSPRKSLSARYLEERGREITVALPPPEDESMLMMEKSYAEMSFDRIAPSAYSSKPYGDEACTPPLAAEPPVDCDTWAPSVAASAAPKVEDAASAAEAACCMSPQLRYDIDDAPIDEEEELAQKECGQEVTIVEIEEEEIIEEDEEEVAPEERQSIPDVRREEQSDSELIDTDDDGEIEDIANRHLRLCLDGMNSPLMAGDGNPIRHSIIHLAMEEDRPALLEAMSETYSFVFEDLDTESASTSNGIIKPAHKERRAKMKRISIATEVAGVYTYLDEQSAESEEEWREGAAVTIEDYHSMVAAAAAEQEAAYMRSMDELARWKASIAATENTGSSSSDPMADLTSRHLVFST